MVTTAVSAVLTGNTGFATIRCLMNYWSLPAGSLLTSNLWAQKRLRWLLPTHIVSLAVLAVSGVQLAQHVAACAESNPPKAKGEYDARWDNTKFFATMLVSVAHFLDPWELYAPVMVIRNCEEWFLMQTYAFISGYLSTPGEQTPKRLRAIWASVVATYIIAQSMYMGLIKVGWSVVPASSATGWEAVAKIPSAFPFVSALFNPWCLCWYLLALVSWRVFAPLWLRLRRPLLCACFVALLSGYVAFPSFPFADGDFLRVHETLAFFPYYVLGITARSHESVTQMMLAWPSARAGALAAALTMVAGALMSTAASDNFARGCLAARKLPPNTGTVSSMGWYTDDDLDMLAPYGDEFEGVWLNFAWYGPACALPAHATLVAATIVLFGRDGGRIAYVTAAGANSLCNYVFHYTVILAIALAGFYDSYSPYPVAKICGAIAIAAAQAQIWMSEPVAAAVRQLLVPKPILRLLLLDE